MPGGSGRGEYAAAPPPPQTPVYPSDPGRGINIRKDAGNWLGDIGQWGMDIVHGAENLAGARDLHVATQQQAQQLKEAGVQTQNETPWQIPGNLYNAANDFTNSAFKTGINAINGLGEYAGLPNWLTGGQGPQITVEQQAGNLVDKIETGLLIDLPKAVTHGVDALFNNYHAAGQQTDHGYWKEGLQAHGGTNRYWVATDGTGTPNILSQAAGQVAHTAWNVANKAFDTPQHMYRAAVLGYQQHGWDGLLAVLAPAITGAVAGSVAGNPEMGLVAADAAGATAAETAAAAGTDVVAANAAPVAASTAPVAEGAIPAAESAIPSATTDAQAIADQAAMRGTVGQQQAMSAVARGAKGVMDSPLGMAARLTGRGFKAVTDALTSPAMAGFQIPDQAFYFTDDATGKLWKQAQAPVGDLSTIGRGLSEMIYGKQNTWLSGATDGIASLVAAPFEIGRAMGYGKSVERYLTAADSTAVDIAYNNSTSYRRALSQIMVMAKGEYGQEVKDNLAGAIARTMPSLEPIAKDLAIAAKARNATEYTLSKRIGELADAGEMAKSRQLPTLGLYGVVKMQGKLSDSYVASRTSRVLGQNPMSVDEARQMVTTNSIRLGDAQAGYKLGQLLQQTGMRSGDITKLVNDLVTSNNVGEWENTVKNAIDQNFFQRIDRIIMRSFGFDSLEWRAAFASGELTDKQTAMLDAALKTRGLEQTYHQLRQVISERTDKLVGNSDAGQPGSIFGVDGQGKDISVIGNDGNRAAAVLENQRGELHLPDFRTFEEEFHKLLDNVKKLNTPEGNFADTMAHGYRVTAEQLDAWVNERVFKPMALLTPGWALRVSLSELALNTARLGPVNMVAGKMTASYIKSERKALAKAAAYADKTVKELRGRADELRLQIKGMSEDDFQLPRKQEELTNLQRHIDWLRSPAATPAPMVERIRPPKGEAEGLGATLPPVDVQSYLAKKGYKISPVEADNLHMLARGVAIGAKEALITAIGKEEFVRNAAYLMYRHGGYLPSAASSIHQSMLSEVDLNGDAGYYEDVKTKKETTTDPITGEQVAIPKTNKIINRGQIKTKLRLMSGSDFRMTTFGGKGYFEGWFYGAHTLAGSEFLGRPAANIYLKLYNEGYRGKQLHAAAVSQMEDVIKRLPDDIRISMARNFTPRKGEVDPINSWANSIVDKLEGTAAPQRAAEMIDPQTGEVVTRTPAMASWQTSLNYESNPHLKLLQDIANNDLPSHVNGFYEKYALNTDRKLFPETVITRSPEPLNKFPLIQRLSTAGHVKVLGPMVNYLSRQPTYVAEFVLERKGLEDAVRRGSITADQADVIAESNATRKMVKYIHNPSDKTKFEEMMSVAAPFYFAQNQAWRRMGRLFAENPGAFMQYAAAMTEVQTVVSNITNKNGISLYTIPGFSLMGMPFTASLSSLQTIDPFSPEPSQAGDPMSTPQTLLNYLSPKFGPVVTVPTKLLEFSDPGIGRTKVGAWAETELEGHIGKSETASQFFYQSAIPNSILRNLIELPVGYTVGQTAMPNFMDNAYIQAQIEATRQIVSSESKQYWDWLGTQRLPNGQKPTAFQKAEAFYTWQQNHWNQNTAAGQTSMQNLLDRSRANASILWFAKIAFGMVSPVSINVGNSDMKMVNKLNNYVKDPKYKGSYSAAVDAFTMDNPWATIDTMAKSKSVYGGYVPENKTMFDWASKNQDLLTQYPLAAMALAPDMSKDTKYYQPAYSLLLNLGLRQRMSPTEFVNQFQITTGNSFYYNWIKPQYEQYRTIDKSAAYKWEQSMINWYGVNHNQVWLSNYNAMQSVARKKLAMDEFGKMLQQTPYGKTPTGQLAGYLLDATMKPGGFYDQMQKTVKSGRNDSASVKLAWQQWLDQQITGKDKDGKVVGPAHPELKQIIMTLFYNL